MPKASRQRSKTKAARLDKSRDRRMAKSKVKVNARVKAKKRHSDLSGTRYGVRSG